MVWEKVSRTVLLTVLTRVGLMLVSIAIIFGLAEAWRRLTFRYIHDSRSRTTAAIFG